VLGFYGQEIDLTKTQFFDSKFISLFILGAAFPTIIGGILQLDIGAKA